jgi:putative ABC transport system substrate-binding protein
MDAFLRAFRQGLRDQGYVEGENVAIEYRFAENQADRLPALATELVRRRVSAIATHGIGAFAAKAATPTIPIAFIVGEDPVRTGLVESLSRPGGNITGTNFVSVELIAKRLELLRQLVPAAARVGVLVNPANAARSEVTVKDVQAAASALGLQVLAVNAGTSTELTAAFDTMMRERADAIFIGNDPLFTSRRIQLILLAARHALPASYPGRQYPEVGGLMSYGSNIADAYRQIGIYTGRILRGAKPADLPVVQSSKFELVINAETSRLLGLTLPPSLLAIADEVIE